MQISSPQSPKEPEAKSFLFVGPGGGGKTALAMQLPGLCFVDIDRNLDGPEKHVRQQNKNLNYAYENVWLSESREPLEMHQCYDRLVEVYEDIKRGVLAKTYNFKFVCTDGLTLLGDIIKQKIMVTQKRSAMETRDWDAYKTNLAKIIIVKNRDLNAMGVHTVLTSHENELSRADKANIMQPVLLGYRPAVQGGIADTFSGLFTDVWGCTSEPAPGGKVEFKISTMKTQYRELKNSFGMPNEITVQQDQLAWPLLEEYLKGCV